MQVVEDVVGHLDAELSNLLRRTNMCVEGTLARTLGFSPEPNKHVVCCLLIGAKQSAVFAIECRHVERTPLCAEPVATRLNFLERMLCVSM